MRTFLGFICLLPALMASSIMAQTQTSPVDMDIQAGIEMGPQVEGQVFTYATGGETYEGYLARNTSDDEPRPAVLVVHEWWGLNDYARARADQLAALGFVALAVDMYGGGEVASHPDEAGTFSRQVMQDWPAARARLEAAMTELRKNPWVAADKGMAAIGYCFGGGVVMNMALSGMPIEAAISFHGSPAQAVSNPQDFSGRVQIHNGAQDPLVKRDALMAMAEALKARGAEVEVINYPEATHSFTNPHADQVAEQYDLPLAYNAAADAASWQAALLTLDKALNDN
ncbi:Dienelactone hydrolase [Modicisalibacter ilicicola DSM 19980]|uniref:Dienelactone hydrolase n=1 Tax=Modicisalibacter ilicicola DSM 19980 TaxID=1121942 RepID=A0A1M4T478_9GAMM|nr:dienelactone hydrolase family protein [Halomonas ilicicola]SHE39241.1 Dienelactone hydrolase [Halomonas ilicicola DSM 19980]